MTGRLACLIALLICALSYSSSLSQQPSRKLLVVKAARALDVNTGSMINDASAGVD